MADFLGLPDISFMKGISGLDRKCREWQVSTGEESSETGTVDSATNWKRGKTLGVFSLLLTM